MMLQLKNGEQSTLAQVLLAREKRVERQLNFMHKYHASMISLTMIIPGIFKNSDGVQYLFKQAMSEINTQLSIQNIAIIETIYFLEMTGPEAFIVIDYSPYQLKKMMMDIEESHPLGRLWDIDVIDEKTCMSIPRRYLNYPARQCFVCRDEAKICARAKKHNIDELYAYIYEKIMTFAQNENQSNKYLPAINTADKKTK